MPSIWIVHRRDRERAALERLAAAPDAVAGAPVDARFEHAAPAEVVVLGLADDWEAELEFAHRHRARLGGARWILVGDPAAADTARALFDQLSLDYMAYPPPADALRRLLASAAARPRHSLSQRALRDSVSGRFSRWLADLDLPELLRGLDPRLAEVPLRVHGEPGTGRATLVRYVHQFGGTTGGRLVHVACDADSGAEDVHAALERAGLYRDPAPAVCLWLDELGRVAPRGQRELLAWMDAGGAAAIRTPRLRWVASVDVRDPALDPALARRLGTLCVELPPLRERTGHLASIAAETAAWWARGRRETPRRLAPDALKALEDHPWPGNLAELEAVLLRTLAATSVDPIGAADLELDGAAPEPVEALSLGELIEEEELSLELPRLEREEEAEEEEEPAAEATSLLLDTEALAEEPAEAPLDLGPEQRDTALRRLVNALHHQVRNPLATLRTFAELLPERFDDPEFRDRFAEMLRDDVGRMHGLLGRVDQLATLDAPRRRDVDVAGLLEGLLERRREDFRRRHLLVLKELDPSQSTALADPDHLTVAFETLIDKALELIPERGDLYLASRRHGGDEEDGKAGSTTRVLMRFHDPAAREHRGVAASEHSLELLIAELLVRAQGGTLTLGASEAEERVLVVDLPAE